MSVASVALGESLLRAEHLTRIYPDGEVNALLDVSFDIRKGEFVTIMGPSGSGKSTLLNLLGALDKPTSGEAYFGGKSFREIASLDALRAQRIGFVFQSFHLLPMLTAQENVQIPMFEGKLTAAQRRQKAAELLAAVKLTHRAGHLPNRLSVGERQRVAIARALANDPELLLADEPTGNLDSRTGDQIMQLFAELHAQRQMTLVIITHSDEVAQRSQRILRIRDGRIEADERLTAA